jgi:predicted transcriptional regulator
VSISASTKEAFLEIVQDLSEDEALDLLDFIRMRLEPEILAETELAEVREGIAAIKSGDVVTDEEFRAEFNR